MARRVTRKSRPAKSPSKPLYVEEPREEWTPPRWLAMTGAAGAVLLFLVIYLLRLDQVVGLYQDDAWYAVLAKSLATGQGYTLISAPAAGIGAWIYPPGYPWLLSLAWRAWPEFPQNVWLLKSLSVASMFGAGIAGYFYFTRVRETPPYVAAGIALATVLSPALVFLATSTLMSECVFMLAQMVAILTIERAVLVSRTGRGWPYVVLGALLASFTFLTRAIGMSLLLGAFLYLLKERLIRGAVAYALVAGVLVGPLWIASWVNAPTEEQRQQQASYIVGRMSEIFWQRQAGNPYEGEIGVSDLPARVWNNAMAIAGQGVGVMVIAPLPYWEKGGEVTAEGGNASLTTRVLSLALSALAIAGFLSVVMTRVTLIEIVILLFLGVILIFPWAPFRYLLPLQPFILFYILMGLRSVRNLYRKWLLATSPQPRWILPGAVLGCLVALNVYANVKHIVRKQSSVQADHPEWLRVFEEHEALFSWIRNNIPLGQHTFIAQNPPLLYLYTGQKTLPAADAALRREVWEQHRVRYLAQMGVPRPPDPNEAEQRLETVYRTHGEYNLRVVDFGDKPLK